MIRILEQKRAQRAALAALSFPEKLRIVEKLRDAALQLAQARTGPKKTR
jgi:hypothetical protein